MSIVPTYELKPGMTLARDVYSPNGRFLMKGDTELQQEHLRIFKLWGVTEVEIAQSNNDDLNGFQSGEHDPEKLAAVKSCLLERFRHADLEHPAMRELFRLMLKRNLSSVQHCTDNSPPASGTKDSETGPDEPTYLSQPLLPDLKQVAEEIDKLPSLPSLFFELQEALASHKSNANSLANIISKDPSLTARLLGLVNSPFYGFPSRIDSISRAVNLVGTKKISILALATTCMMQFRHIPDGIMNMRLFWKHSLATGIASRSIAGMIGVTNQERFFVTGLLHDLGRLILFHRFPQACRYGLGLAQENKQLLCTTENDLLGCDHAEIGGMILEKMAMPQSLTSAIRHHHQPFKKDDDLCPPSLHLADILINAMGLGSSGEKYVPPLDSRAWERLGLGIGSFAVITKQLDRILAKTIQDFFSETA